MIASYKPKLVLHTTESFNYYPDPDNFYGHQSWPTLTGPDKHNLFYQHFPVTKGAYALKNMPGGVETNRENVVQLEIVWQAAHLMPVSLLERIGDFIIWWADYFEVDLLDKANWAVFVGADKRPYGMNADQRFSFYKWRRFCGVCGHQHVPENSHWDPGGINVEFLYNYVNKTKELDEMKPSDWIKFVQAVDKDGNKVGPVERVNLLTDEINGVEPGINTPQALREDFHEVFGVDMTIHTVDPQFVKQFRRTG